MANDTMLGRLERLRRLAAWTANGSLSDGDKAALQQEYDRIAASLDRGDPSAAQVAGRDVADPATVVAVDEAAWRVTANGGTSTMAGPAGPGDHAPAGVRLADCGSAQEVAERTRDRLLFDQPRGCHAMAGRATQRAIDLLG